MEFCFFVFVFVSYFEHSILFFDDSVIMLFIMEKEEKIPRFFFLKRNSFVYLISVCCSEIICLGCENNNKIAVSVNLFVFVFSIDRIRWKWPYLIGHPSWSLTKIAKNIRFNLLWLYFLIVRLLTWNFSLFVFSIIVSIK